MKKILMILILALSFSACEMSDDDASTLKTEMVPIESVEIPETFTIGETYTIKIKYQKTTICHKFSGLYSENDENIQYVGVLASYDPANSNCKDEVGIFGNTELEFTPETNNLYIFKFWQGTDSNGDGIYITKEIASVNDE